MDGAAASSHGGVFISYRREETAYAAGWLYDRLVEHLGRDKVFKDIDSIQLGDDWVEVINDEVSSCDVLLALIGDRWLTITDEQGRSRLEDPHDFVRLEIEAALTRNVRVIPILVEGARMPHLEELPASLSRLTRRQALELSPQSFDFDLGRLLPVLDRTLAEARPGPPGGAPPEPPPEPTPAPTEPVPPVAGGTGPPPVLDVPSGEQDRERKNRRLVVIAASAAAAVVAVAVIAAVVASGGDGDGQSTTTQPVTGPVDVVVEANQLWTPTGVSCQPGDEIKVTATGFVLHNNRVPSSTVTPDGIPGHEYDKFGVDVVESANTASLIGSVDENTAQFVGSDGTYKCENDGNFLLGINDTGTANNSGHWDATVTVNPG
jgi:hypothetical protein